MSAASAEDASRARVLTRDIQNRRGLCEIAIVDVRHQEKALVAQNGRRYVRQDANLWICEDRDRRDVVFVNTGRHGDGITLRPLFFLVGGIWRNAITGQPAPEDIDLP